MDTLVGKKKCAEEEKLINLFEEKNEICIFK